MKQALAPISRERYHNARLICDCALASRWAGMRGSSGESGVPLPDAMEAVDRMAFVGGRKAQGRDSHALVLEVEQTRGEARKLIEQRVVGRKMDNERVCPPLQ